MVHYLPSYATLLCCEGEGGRRRSKHVLRGCLHDVQAAVANEKLDISKAKCVVGVGPGIFTGPQQKEESDDNHVRDRLAATRPCSTEGHSQDVVDHLYRNGFYPRRRGIRFGVGAELALDPKIDPTDRVFADVLGPHAGERLAHRT